jgi:two-component system, NarL family, response regulator NreC
MESQKPCRIVIAEDHKMLRDMLRSVFESDPHAGIEVVGEAGDGREAVQCVARHHPALVLTGLSMPVMNGHQAIFEIKKSFPSTKILVLTMHSSPESIMGALKAGADGYVLKRDSLEELLTAIRNVLQGNSHLSPEVSQQVVQGYLQAADRGDTGLPREGLTPRERDIIRFVAEGYKSKEIAEALSISLKTVETHRANTMKKLGLRNVAEMTAYAIQEGLVQRPALRARDD